MEVIRSQAQLAETVETGDKTRGVTGEGHPTTVFCITTDKKDKTDILKISVLRGKYFLEFSITWIRLKISTWAFYSGAIFEAYLKKAPYDFLKYNLFTIYSPC